MVKRKKIILLVFLVFVVTTALLTIVNFDALRNFIERDVGLYGYPAIFISAFLADLLAQPIGPEVPSIFGFVLGLNKVWIFVIVVSGSYLASIINFNIGRRFLSDKILVFCRLKSRIKYCKLFDKHGKLSLFIAAVTPVPYVIFCWLSGAFGMQFKDFFKYGLIPRALRIFFMIFIAAGLFKVFV